MSSSRKAREREEERDSARKKWRLKFKLNGRTCRADTEPVQTLLDFLRLELNLTGTKGACLEGECGSCYVLVDGRPMNSCLILVPQIQNREVVTVEGLAHGDKLDPIQLKFIECGAVQCGYCTPGLIVAAKALLLHNPRPSPDQIATALEGNICRCTGYNSITRALREAAAMNPETNP